VTLSYIDVVSVTHSGQIWVNNTCCLGSYSLFVLRMYGWSASSQDAPNFSHLFKTKWTCKM